MIKRLAIGSVYVNDEDKDGNNLVLTRRRGRRWPRLFSSAS